MLSKEIRIKIDCCPKNHNNSDRDFLYNKFYYFTRNFIDNKKEFFKIKKYDRTLYVLDFIWI
jgi:hypothetical protein